jgi:hypothetical protein
MTIKKMKTITVTTATIDFGNWSISATGQLDEYYDWEVEIDYKTPQLSTRRYTDRENFSDQEELEEYLWTEVDRLNRKYSSCVFEEVSEEVEDEDYEDEDYEEEEVPSDHR